MSELLKPRPVKKSKSSYRRGLLTRTFVLKQYTTGVLYFDLKCLIV